MSIQPAAAFSGGRHGRGGRRLIFLLRLRGGRGLSFLPRLRGRQHPHRRRL
ncbi:MAG TPA: hypothetical protein VEH31_24965 [Streptosporangiaceae bacterium]|nr:hypothetical protein [Streptosporangiaceae bacterium]